MSFNMSVDEIIPAVERLGFTCRVLDNPVAGYGPFLIAERHEADNLPTMLTYGHGDVVFGYAETRESSSGASE